VLLFTSCQRVFQSRSSALRWHKSKEQIRKLKHPECLWWCLRRNHINDLRRKPRGIDFDQVTVVPYKWNIASFLMEKLLKAKTLTSQQFADIFSFLRLETNFGRCMV
jgi:hypothetical protein